MLEVSVHRGCSRDQEFSFSAFVHGGSLASSLFIQPYEEIEEKIGKARRAPRSQQASQADEFNMAPEFHVRNTADSVRLCSQSHASMSVIASCFLFCFGSQPANGPNGRFVRVLLFAMLMERQVNII